MSNELVQWWIQELYRGSGVMGSIVTWQAQAKVFTSRRRADSKKKVINFVGWGGGHKRFQGHTKECK